MAARRPSRKAWRRQLEAWLRQVAQPDEADRLFHHLGDISDSCGQVASLLTRLPEIDLQGNKGRKAFATLYGEMFEHLHTHLSTVRPLMRGLLNESFRVADRRGEL
jgi:hypothetical protein